MFQWLWEILAIPIGYLMQWSYQLFHDVLHTPVPYLFAMFLFALITRVLQFPLSIKQQRTTAKTAALNPLMQEIQKKFAKDKNRQQQEIQKLQEEMGVSMMSGCLPMLITFPIMFTVIEIIYKPLTYMLRISKELITELSTIVHSMADQGMINAITNERWIQNDIIKSVQNPAFSEFFSGLSSNAAYAEEMGIIQNLDLNIGSIHLLDTPSISQPSLLWLFPAFMIVTMFLSQLVAMKASGQAGSGQPGTGKTMMIVMTLMFAAFSFMYPAGFSLYWGFSNLIMMAQSAILRKIINPEEIKQQVLDEYYAKKKNKKASKTVKVKDDSGEVVEKTMSASELARLRLQKAREQDEARYAGEEDAPPAETSKKKKIQDALEEDDVQELTDETLAEPTKSGGQGKKKGKKKKK